MVNTIKFSVPGLEVKLPNNRKNVFVKIKIAILNRVILNILSVLSLYVYKTLKIKELIILFIVQEDFFQRHNVKRFQYPRRVKPNS